MDVAAVLLDAAEVQRDRCCSAGAVRLDMFRFGVDGLDKRGLSCPKGTKNDNFQFSLCCHPDKIGQNECLPFRSDKGITTVKK